MKTSKSSPVLIFLISAYLLIPILFTLVYSFFIEWNDVLPKGPTIKFYISFLSDAAFWSTVGRTVIIALLPTGLSLLVVLLAMYVITVYEPRLDRIIQVIATLPYALQGVIIAISVLSLYANAPAPFSNRILLLTGTYMIITLPYMYRGIRNSLLAIQATRLIEAAQLLGASRFRSFFAVVVPNMASGLIVSTLLSIALIFGDFVIVNIIGGNYFETAQMYILKVMYKSGQEFSAIGIVLFAVTLLISVIVHTLNAKSISSQEHRK